MEKLDILNRDEFVAQLIHLIENLSDNKTSSCFAINGSWGIGKSFVLDMLETQLNTIYSEKYFVIRYNSWKYDYYEEPLIAIVSAIIKEIEEKTELFPDSKEKQEILGMFKAAGISLLSLTNSAIKSQTGIDFQSAYETIVKGEKEGAEKYDKAHSYDTYLELNKVIDKLSSLLQEIAKDYTAIIIVDELDRCIPEYAIKVLERLHHLTEEKSNIITVLSIDKNQLLKSIEHSFGTIDAEKYLEKFIHFEIQLDKGDVSEKIAEKYSNYISLFDKDIIPLEDPIEEYIQIIFKDIDPRTQDQLLRRALLIHKLLFTEKKDYSFMCIELIATVMYYEYGYRMFIGTNKININSFESVFTPYTNSKKPPLIDFFAKKFSEIPFDIITAQYTNHPSRYTFPEVLSLPSAILFTWCLIHYSQGGSIIFQYTKGGVYEQLFKNVEDLKKFIETMRLIK